MTARTIWHSVGSLTDVVWLSAICSSVRIRRWSPHCHRNIQATFWITHKRRVVPFQWVALFQDVLYVALDLPHQAPQGSAPDAIYIIRSEMTAMVVSGRFRRLHAWLA